MLSPVAAAPHSPLAYSARSPAAWSLSSFDGLIPTMWNPKPLSFLYFQRVAAAQVKQKQQDERDRVIRAQVFAEFHQKILQKEIKIAGQELEIRELKAALSSAREGVSKSAAKSRPSLLLAVDRNERSKLQTVMSCSDGEVVLDTFISGASAQIFVMNLVCVRRGEWLNSETINVYVLMIEAAAKKAGMNVTSFNSYFMSKIETEV
jgi:Ulp1 family protease